MDVAFPVLFIVIMALTIVIIALCAMVLCAGGGADCCAEEDERRRAKCMNGVVAVPLNVHSRSSPGVFGWERSESLGGSNNHFHNSSRGHHIVSMDTSGGYPSYTIDITSSSSNCDSGWGSSGNSGGDSGGCSGGDSGGGSTSCD